MKNLKTKSIFLMVMVSVLGLFVNPTSSHMALKEEERHEILSGVKEMVVVVNHGLSRRGPLNMKLQELVEKRLSDAGLTVLKEEDQNDSYDPPALCVDIAILKSETSRYSFLINARFNEEVTLLRDNNKIAFATTWSVTKMGVGDHELITETVDKLVDFFLIDHRLSNDSKFESN